ncbi:hypothetical protein MMC22_008344 [Lobaria immixta]|nr:hypothetical protein [Lobaria immixta]
MSFAEVVDGIRRTSQPDRLPRYGQGVCRAGIRIPTPTQAKLPPRLRPVVPSESASQRHHRVASSEPSFGSTLTIPSKVMAIFEVQLEGTNAESPKPQPKRWITLERRLHVKIHRNYLRSAVASMAALSERQGSSLVCETFGSNIPPANTISKGGKAIAVEYVDKTTASNAFSPLSAAAAAAFQRGKKVSRYTKPTGPQKPAGPSSKKNSAMLLQLSIYIVAETRKPRYKESAALSF